MTRWRTIARRLSIVWLVGEAAAAFAGLVVLAVRLVQGTWPSAESLVELAGFAALAGLIAWAIRDASKRAEARRIARAEDVGRT